MRFFVPMTRCPLCLKTIKPGTRVCPHCGAPLGSIKSIKK